jgi:hypothetical protein
VFARPEPRWEAQAGNHWPAKGALLNGKAHVEHMLRAAGFQLAPNAGLASGAMPGGLTEVVRLRPGSQGEKRRELPSLTWRQVDGKASQKC